MSTIVQHANSNNGLAQTFNTVFSGGPVEGNLLVALSWHDEGSDIEAITSSGWLRQATQVFDLGATAFRASVWAKFAGASESSTIAWDLGEVNKRCHGWGVEISGVGFVELAAEDAADSVGAERDPAGTTLQVGPITVPQGMFAIAISGLNNSSTIEPNWSADADITDIGTGLNVNFRSTGIGFADGIEQTISPTATWGSSRQGTQILAVLGVPPPVPPSSILKALSSFQVTPAA